MDELLEAMNHYAANYRAPVEESAHVFLTSAEKALPKSLINYMKTTPCTTVMTNESWLSQLESVGYARKDIHDFDEIALRPGDDLLQIKLERYARNVGHRDHSLYQAIQACIVDYQHDPAFSPTLEQLASYHTTDIKLARQLFETAHSYMQNMTELESKLKLAATYYGIRSPIYEQSTQAMIAIKAEIDREAPFFHDSMDEYLANKSKELIAIARNKHGNLTDFHINLESELMLIRVCGSDPIQLKKTLDILNGDNLDDTPEFFRLAGIQKINRLAENQKKLTVETIFDGRPEKATWDNIMKMRCMQHPYAYEITRNALNVKLIPPNNIENFELFPGKKLIDILEDGATADDSRSMHQIIKEAIANAADMNEASLQKISDIYHMDRETTTQLFDAALSATSSQSTIEAECFLIKKETVVDVSFDLAAKNLSIVGNQLTMLLQNSKRMSTYVDVYIDNQKQELLKIANDPVALEVFTKKLNIISAIGSIIDKHGLAASQQLKVGLGDDRLFVPARRNIALLSEKMHELQDKFPKKAAKINVALTEVLTNDPSMTFDKMVMDMDNPKLEKGSPIKKLKDAMGEHRWTFLWLVSFFYPIETNTTLYFRQKIQEQTHLTSKDLGHDEELVSSLVNKPSK